MAQQDIEQLWELQTRQSELRRHVVQLTSQLNTGERERSMLDLTIREMKNMDAGAKVYKPIGKMFVLTPKDKLHDEFVEVKRESAKRDENRIALREQFVTKLRESESKSEELATKIDATRTKNRK